MQLFHGESDLRGTKWCEEDVINLQTRLTDEEFEENIFDGLPHVSMEKSGRFVRIVLRGEAKAMLSALEELKPAVVEQMPMDFEELFIHEVEERGQRK